MIRSSRALPFILAASLLLLPTPQIHALSWDTVTSAFSWAIEYISNNKRLQELMPIAVFAGAIGIMILLGRKSKQPVAKEEIMVGKSVCKGRKGKIKGAPVLQPNVYNQFHSDGGGGASCGYQLLLRSCQIVKAISNGDNDLQSQLEDHKVIQTYYGTGKSKVKWRLHILDGRSERRIKLYLSNKFEEGLRPLKQCPNEEIIDPDDDPRNDKENKGKKDPDRPKRHIWEIYRSAMRGLIHNIVPALLNNETPKYDLCTDESIIADLLIFIRVDNENLNNYVRQKNKIRQYIDFKKLRQAFDCTKRSSGITLKKIMNNIKTDPYDKAGEWLDDGEVELLVEFEKEAKGLLPRKNIKYGFTVIPEFNLIGKKDVDTVTPFIQDELKKSLNKKGQYFHIFLAGTMKQKSGRSGTQGHWFPIILHKQKTGRREYIVTDSAGNHSRINDKRVKTLINMIEKSAKGSKD